MLYFVLMMPLGVAYFTIAVVGLVVPLSFHRRAHRGVDRMADVGTDPNGCCSWAMPQRHHHQRAHVAAAAAAGRRLRDVLRHPATWPRGSANCMACWPSTCWSATRWSRAPM
jgi:hypothetical protein